MGKHPWWQSLRLTLAKVVRRNSEDHTVDIVLQSGGSVLGVPVLGSFGSLAGGQYLPQVKPSVTGYSETYGGETDLPLPGTGDLWAVVAFLRGNMQSAVVLGFLPPLHSMIYTKTPGIELFLHESGVYRLTTPDGATEVHWPDGTYLRVGAGTAAHNMVAENPTWSPPSSTVHPDVMLQHGSGLILHIDPSGNLTLSTTGSVQVSAPKVVLGQGTSPQPVARVGDAVQVTISGTTYTGTITSGSSEVQAN